MNPIDMNKSLINKILLPVFCIIALSCERHDKIDDLAMIGHRVPASYWEVKSTEIKYGESVAFKAQYYTDGPAIKQLSVWHDVNEHIAYTVECPLVTTFKYSVSFDNTELVRQFQKLHEFRHTEELWNQNLRAYFLDDKFKVSYTLSPVEWMEVEEYDQNYFDELFPDNFEQAFKDSVGAKLQVMDYRKILTVDNPRMDTDTFDATLDSTFNENSGRYDYFFKNGQEEVMRNHFNTIPFDSLTYDKISQKFKINYVREYFLNSKFAVMDENNRIGFSENKQVKVN